ncbi:universal stress protein [Flavobacterium salilacus subsp. salilacus]|uniref:universal stress protein n=1 Tax=Flavobacterium TaxID=237 RepID=UPI001075399E|nr:MULTISPECIES: universal stress protein [Flavobacterium]KAF2516337.1 universal stress protein [Flavobacterium salilacus subsp. salilacus]MBE1613870.1 universal stress protein [Flavobacterium sp. SaA2.13]
MKNILFPTDFSETANAAFTYALKFADIFEADIIVLHVYSLPIVEPPVLPGAAKEVFDIVAHNQEEKFEEEIKKLEKIAKKIKPERIKLRNILMGGDLTYSINEVCNDENVDLIVMGTTGASGIKEIFLGSNTATVIANAKTTVLGVPVEAEFHHQIKNIVFTTQYKEEDGEALEQLVEIAKRIGANISCLHIKNDDDPSDIDEKINEWKMLYKNENIDFFNISGDHIEQTILDFIENQQIDMVAMLKHKRSFFESLFHRSLTKKMAYHSKVPILVFKC